MSPSPSLPPVREQRSRAERLLSQFHEEGSVPTKKLDLEMLRDLLPFARPHRALYIVSLALMPISALLLVVQPRLLQRAVDAMGVGKPAAALTQVVAIYGMVVLGRFLASFVETYCMQLAGQRTIADLRLSVFAHIERLSLRYFDRTPTGRVVTRVTNDIDSLGELFGTGAVTAIGDVMVLLGVVVSMLSIDASLSFVAFAVVPPLVLFVELFRRRLRAAQRKIRSAVARLNAFMGEQVQGIQVVQAFSKESECQAGYHELNLAHRDANHEQIRYDARMYSVVEAIATVCIGLLLWFSARELGAFASPEQAEIHKGTFIAFYAYIQQFFGPIRDLSTKYTAIQSAFAAAERVFGLLAVDELDAPGGDKELPEVGAGPLLELSGVSFRYKEGGPLVLDDVSISIEQGETVALVGATGAGKTTVTALLTRLYETDVGVVRYGGRDVRQIDREALRGRFGVVTQDAFLFSGTLLANVAYGVAEPDRARAETVLARIGALDRFMPRGGLDMVVAERGSNLSAGERQLVAFARVLYRDAPVLILDEATASIDTETEATVQRAQDTLLERRTALVVAHRLSTIRRASRIIVFHRGRVVETGMHEELLSRGGVYARLYELQFAQAAAGGKQALAAHTGT